MNWSGIRPVLMEGMASELLAVVATGLQIVDLLMGFGIGLYVLREAVEILQQANEAG